MTYWKFTVAAMMVEWAFTPNYMSFRYLCKPQAQPTRSTYRWNYHFAAGHLCAVRRRQQAAVPDRHRIRSDQRY